MSDTPPDQEKSLRDELKKRRTQAAQQARTTQSTKPAPPPAAPPRPTEPPAAAPAKTAPLRPQTTTSKQVRLPSTRPPISGRQRNLMIAIGAGVAVIVLLLGALLFTNNTVPATPVPTNVILPSVSASDVLRYLQRVGLNVTNIRVITVPSDQWLATEGLQFDIEFGRFRGTFIILSYADAGALATDAIKIELDGEYVPWKAYSMSNILVLSTPDTPQSLDIEVASHMTTYLNGGVVVLLPTSTGTFLGSAATDSAATMVALAATETAAEVIIPTAPILLVTLTDRPPTETRTPTMTPTLRPTRTATRPVTATVTATRTTLVLVTAVPESTTAVLTATPAPYELEPVDISRAERFAAAAPRFLEPLRMDEAQITTDENGALLHYYTNEGVHYQVALYITRNAAAAADKYAIDAAYATGVQNITGIGEQAMIAAPGSQFAAEVLYQDMVLVVLNPQFGSTVPGSILSQDDLLRLLQRMFIILPTTY